MGLSGHRRKQLDEQMLFERYYIQGGAGYSFNKLVNWAATEIGNNPVTRRPFTYGAIYQAVNRYITSNWKNPEVKNAVIKLDIDYGFSPMSDDDYHRFISEKAKCIYKRKQYMGFLKNNPELPVIDD